MFISLVFLVTVFRINSILKQIPGVKINTKNLIAKGVLMLAKVTIAILFSVTLWSKGIVSNAVSTGTIVGVFLIVSSTKFEHLAVLYLIDFLLEIVSTGLFVYLY